MTDGDTPCSAEEAVTRMLSVEGNGGQYLLGTGTYDPRHPGVPWTFRDGKWGSDCAGAICFAYRIRRSRCGFNDQSQATVCDDLNVDSLLEDADPRRGGHLELGELATIPAPGILLITPTIRIPEKQFYMMGHVRLIIDATKWNPAAPKWADVIYLECHGPNGHRPGVTRNHGASVDQHDAVWPKWNHRAAMVRIRSRP
ncbi:MAG: hypothetical protein H0X39_00810 [Actinobacteria bacterium]|nr:hypothetical protein [Actinomycetota bacterium]